VVYEKLRLRDAYPTLYHIENPYLALGNPRNKIEGAQLHVL
jgi:hypothetical protein